MKYRCLLCNELVGSTIREKNKHLRTHHLQELSKLHLNFDNARLLYFKPILVPSQTQENNQQENTKFNRIYGMSPKRIRKIIMGIRGKKVEGIHMCSCCKNITEHNWEYLADGYHPIYICNKCHLIVKAVHCKCNIIYNALETNRRKH